nr:Ubiquitin conjugating enzyme E2 J1 [Hymenolepis microstoma]
MREAQELSKPTELYYAQPLEDNLFEWHFTIRGPEGSEFEGGIYHGQISLPTEYPMKPPNIMLLTPNGRFEQYRQICLSISGYHPETWCPSWSIRTALLAIIGFMPTDGAGAIGSMSVPTEERKKLAISSKNYVCNICGPTKDLLLPLTSASNLTAQEAKVVASQFILTDPNTSKSETLPPEAPNSESPEGSSAIIGTSQMMSQPGVVSTSPQPPNPLVNGTANPKPIYWLCYPVYSMAGITNGTNTNAALSSADNSSSITSKKDPPLSFENWLKQVHPSSSANTGSSACLQTPRAETSQQGSSKDVSEHARMWEEEIQAKCEEKVESKINKNNLEVDKEVSAGGSMMSTSDQTAGVEKSLISKEGAPSEENAIVDHVNERSEVQKKTDDTSETPSNHQSVCSSPKATVPEESGLQSNSPAEPEAVKPITSETRSLEVENSNEIARRLFREAAERHRQRAQRILAPYEDTNDNPNRLMPGGFRSERGLKLLIFAVGMALIALIIRRIIIMSTTGPL